MRGAAGNGGPYRDRPEAAYRLSPYRLTPYSLTPYSLNPYRIWASATRSGSSCSARSAR